MKSEREDISNKKRWVGGWRGGRGGGLIEEREVESSGETGLVYACIGQLKGIRKI